MEEEGDEDEDAEQTAGTPGSPEASRTVTSTIRHPETGETVTTETRTVTHVEEEDDEEPSVGRETVSSPDETAYSPARAEMERRLDKNTTIHFEDTAIEDVLEFLAATTGINIILDERVLLYDDMQSTTAQTGPGSITPTIDPQVRKIQMEDIPLRDTLGALTQQKGLDFVVTDHFVWISRPGVLDRERERITSLPDMAHIAGTPIEKKLDTTVDLHWGSGSLRDMLTFLQRTVEFNLVLDERVIIHPGEPPTVALTGPGAIIPTVDLTYRGITWDDAPLAWALRALLSKRGLDYTVTEHFVWISRPDVLESEKSKFDELYQPLPRATPEDIRKKLLATVELNLGTMNIRDAFTFIEKIFGINLVLDERVVIDGKKPTESETRGWVTPTVNPTIYLFYFQDVPLRHVLKALLCSIGLDYQVTPSFIWVSRPDVLRHESFEELEAVTTKTTTVTHMVLGPAVERDAETDFRMFTVLDKRDAEAEAETDRPRFVVLEREEIERKLDTSVDLNFGDSDIRKIRAFLENTVGLGILVDERVMLDPDEPDASEPRDGITPTVDPQIHGVLLTDIRLRDALKALFLQIGLSYKAEDHFVWVSSPDVLMNEQFEELETRYYNFKFEDESVMAELCATLEELAPEVTDPDTGDVLSYMDYHPAETRLIIRNRPSNFQKLEQVMKRFTEEPEPKSG